jgi:hypothetical protein
MRPLAAADANAPARYDTVLCPLDGEPCGVVWLHVGCRRRRSRGVGRSSEALQTSSGFWMAGYPGQLLVRQPRVMEELPFREWARTGELGLPAGLVVDWLAAGRPQRSAASWDKFENLSEPRGADGIWSPRMANVEVHATVAPGPLALTPRPLPQPCGPSFSHIVSRERGLPRGEAAHAQPQPALPCALALAGSFSPPRGGEGGR